MDERRFSKNVSWDVSHFQNISPSHDKRGPWRFRHLIFLSFLASLMAQFFFLYEGRDNLLMPRVRSEFTVNLEGPWTQYRPRRVVHWMSVMNWNESNNTALASARQSVMPGRTVEPLGTQPLWNSSQYDSLRYYWNDPTWSQKDTYEFYPTCNNVHELDLGENGPFEFLYSDGAFRFSVLYHPPEKLFGQAHLRMLLLNRPFTRASMVMAMNDAAAMERVQASPWVVTIYQACGLSMLSELMTGGTLTSRLPVRQIGRQVKYFPTQRLRYAMEATLAVADIHAADIANLDIQTKNYMMDEHEQIHLNDFNLARLGDGRTTANKTMEANFHQDLMTLGKLLYAIRTGRRLKKDMNEFWKEDLTAAASKLGTTVAEQHWGVLVRQLNFSSLDEGKITHRANLALSTLEWALKACLQPITSADRPTARQLAQGLTAAYETIKFHANNRTFEDIQQLFLR